ncbi:isoprenylcysteine carboxylmethyltransferase family protein [uncultured Paraglaciecola sp.]|uniref:methyltransferase family protein n=1 Tax=uncultured Paraglaciecola sp. TaxID=1765024 RepID=UPI002627C2A5|nr:isoprenylcysteine carboxylmethyltransferase family protein [uncultured Paraglaciecola sp.]
MKTVQAAITVNIKATNTPSNDIDKGRLMASMKNTGRFIYSLVCYGAGVASLIYFILFVNDLWLPQTVNSIVPSSSLAHVIIINTLALLLFGVQHSVMARPAFKRWFAGFIDPSVERANYVLATALAISGMCYIWIPFGPIVWQIESDMGISLLRGIAFFGWGFLFLATFMINHFELFGLRQTFDPMQGKPVPDATFKMSGFYKIVRHPIQTGVLIGVWAVPLSTASHLVFAAGISAYIFVGLYFEEKDLIKEFGDTYLDYMQRVKRVIPFIY